MAIRSGLFNSVNGDRKYKAEHFAEYFATFISNGVFPVPSTGFQVVENANMTVAIKDGKAWIKGYYAVNEGSVILSIPNADGVLNRIDRVVLRYDTENRNIDIALKQGTFATNPVAPPLQRDADAYEIALADIYVGKGVTSIIQANITDLRLDKNLCGIVHGVIDQVDTTTLFNQYQSWIAQQKTIYESDLEDWTTAQQADFQAWFESIQGILDSDVAGNLLLLIQKNESDIKSLIKTRSNVSVLASGWKLNSSTNRYEYKITDADITATSIVDVNIQLDYLDYAKMMLSACISYDGYVILYASGALDSNLMVDYRITKEVV